MSENALWAIVSKDDPWNEWWPKFSAAQRWPKDTLVEKWSSADFVWSRVLDSAKTFSLFAKHKVLIIFEADKALKSEKKPDDLLQQLSKGPHKIVFVSDSAPPKGIKLQIWRSPAAEAQNIDDKSAFRWIDSIHQLQISSALDFLETSLRQEQHPLALLQLLARDFRLGRLIQHALYQRYREAEIVETLRVNPYAIKKWQTRKSIKKTQWAEIFDRLRRADLELKSGYDDTWALRKLTFDLIQILTGISTRPILQPRQTSPLLWPVVPSFA